MALSRRSGAALTDIEAVYRTSFSQFCSVAAEILHDRDAARDAVQEAFAKAVRTRRDFRGDGPLEAWLWRAVGNRRRVGRRLGRGAAPRGQVPLPDEAGGGGWGRRRRRRCSPGARHRDRRRAERAHLRLTARPRAPSSHQAAWRTTSGHGLGAHQPPLCSLEEEGPARAAAVLRPPRTQAGAPAGADSLVARARKWWERPLC